jgi:hypothetical protein
MSPLQLPVRHLGLDRRNIEIYRHGCAVGCYPPRQLTTLRALESASQRSTADVRCFRWTGLVKHQFRVVVVKSVEFTR